MKLFAGQVLISQVELDKALKDAEVRGVEKGEKTSKNKIEELDKALARKEKAFQKTHEELSEANEKLEVYEEERDNVRDVIKQQIHNDDKAAVNDARSETLDAREARIKDELAELEAKTSSVQKSAYADGLADGLRKAHEITATDRENAMKIAMVSAASHTPTENMKELNSVHQLTAGSSDK